MTRAGVYTRVSSDQQEDGSSLATQEASCCGYCETHGYTVTALFTDTHTGAQLRERPGMSALRELVRAGGVDVVVAHAVDRLARHQHHLAIIWHEITEHGGRLELVTEQLENTPIGRFILAARAFSAEIEREKIIERTVRGRRARAMSGKLLPGRAPLYGYQWADDGKGAYLIDELAAPVVARIYRDYLAGASIEGLAGLLEVAGIPSPAGGRRWSSHTLNRILRHPAYAGKARAWMWRLNPMTGAATYVVDEDTIALGAQTIPAIIPRETWQAVQDRLDTNRIQSGARLIYREAALLRGRVSCGHCERPLATQITGVGVNYRCISRYTRADPSCPAPVIRAGILDGQAWELAASVIVDPEILCPAPASDPHAGHRRELERAIAEASRRRANLIAELAAIDDATTRAAVRVHLETLSVRLASLEAERAVLTTQPAPAANLAQLIAWCRSAAPRLDALTFAERRQAIELLDIRARLWRHGHEPRWELAIGV